MKDRVLVEMKTSVSENPITIELYAKEAPVSVENFLTYVRDGFYDGTVFHRVIEDFMIQGGGFSKDLKKKQTRPPIKNEAKNGLKNERGTLAMARTSDINSATAQFFINSKDNPNLDHTGDHNYGYAVFGRVTDGMDVVDKIRKVKTHTPVPGMDDVPAEPVIIEKVTIKE